MGYLAFSPLFVASVSATPLSNPINSMTLSFQSAFRRVSECNLVVSKFSALF